MPSARPRARPAAWQRSWAELNRQITACTRCHLAASRTHAVPYRGSLRPSILFVGEAPGAAEDRTGLPFVGAAGRRLDRAIESVGLGPEDVGILNLLKCRPGENRFDPVAAAACRPYLDRQLDLLAPRVIVTLGARALAAFDPEAPAIGAAAGQPRRWQSRPLFPLLHPAATFRSRRYAQRWTEDLRTLARWLPRWLGPRRVRASL
jgi:uracil-DNA glycosylase family 4